MPSTHCLDVRCTTQVIRWFAKELNLETDVESKMHESYTKVKSILGVLDSTLASRFTIIGIIMRMSFTLSILTHSKVSFSDILRND